MISIKTAGGTSSSRITSIRLESFTKDTALEFKKTVALTATEETATTVVHGLALRDFNGDGRLDLFLVFNRFPARFQR